LIGKIFFLIASFFTVYILISLNKSHALSIAAIAKKQSQIIGYQELSTGAIGKVQASLLAPKPTPVNDGRLDLILELLQAPESSKLIEYPDILQKVMTSQSIKSPYFNEYRFGTQNDSEQINRITDTQVREIIANGYPQSRWCDGYNCEGEKTKEDFAPHTKGYDTF